jgi:hypothetical protein
VWDWLPTILVFVIIYAVLLAFYNPGLLFSDTTTAGGDTGAHHYPAQYLIQELLPNFRLTGWAPGWYAGMPMLTFYFPFPFLLIAILDWFLPYNMAFKFVTALGVFLLPLTAYAMGRLWRLRKPYPIVAAVFALVFVFMSSYTIYGANILSTLAGEFGYMLSFSLVLLWLGTMYRGMEKPRFDMLFVANCLLLMVLALSHIVTTIVLVCLSPGLLLAHRRLRSAGYLGAVGVVGFCLTAFWSLPFAANLEWTAHMAWTQLDKWTDLFPKNWHFIPVAVLAFMGMVYAIMRRERNILPLAWVTVVTLALFWFIPDGRLWNARILPFWYVSLHLWAAYTVAWLARPFMVMMWDLFRAPGHVGRRFFAPVAVVIAGAIILTTSPTASGWIKWNYKGYEGKEGWTQYQEILTYLDTLTPGRVLVEHGDKLDEFGTPRAFEIIPYWTQLDTMEGTLMEASYTAAFHFIVQAELSEQPSNAIIGVDYPGVDVPMGITHMQFMNIPYFLSFYNEDQEERVVTGMLEDPRAELLAVFGDYNIFRISGCSGYVEVMENEPVRLDIEQGEWRDMANQWFLNEDALDTAIVWDNGEEALQQYAPITVEQATTPPEVPIETDGYVTNEMLSNESLEFDTTAIGVPHWIKISYFPNWHVEGAEGPYLASPSFMMVIPTQSHVVLTYGRTTANNVGQGLEVAAFALLLGLTVWRGVVWSRRRRLETAVLESGPLPGLDDVGAGDFDDAASAGLGPETREEGSGYLGDELGHPFGPVDYSWYAGYEYVADGREGDADHPHGPDAAGGTGSEPGSPLVKPPDEEPEV